MSETATDRDDEAIREAQEARTRRAERDRALTAAERLQRVHELCRQLAAIRLANPSGR